MVDNKERLTFLTSLADKVDKPESQDAHVYALADVADVKLRLEDLDGAQKDLASCQRVLDSFDSVETVVHASFYKVNADYYHVRFPAGARTAKNPQRRRMGLTPPRPNKNSPPSTKMPSCTLPASTSRKSPKASASRAPSTSASPRWSPTPSTTSASSSYTRSWTP